MTPTVYRPRHNYWRRRIRGSVTFPDSSKLVATNSNVQQLGFPSQSRIVFDGKHLYAAWADIDGVSDFFAQMSYALEDDKRFKTSHNFPNNPRVDDGISMSIAWRPDFGLWMYGVFDPTAAGSPRVAHNFKSDNDMISSGTFSGTAVGSSALSRHPSVIIDVEGYTWYAEARPNGDIRVGQSTDPFVASAFAGDGTATLTTTATWPHVVQLVTYSNGDMGLLSGESDNVLSYYHYTRSTTTWETAVTVDSDLANYYDFRGVVTRNDKLFIIWKDGTGSDLRFRIYTQSTDSFNTAADFATDLDVNSGYSSCANVGVAESAYVFYHDGINIVYKTWDGATVSGKTTFAAGVTLLSGTFTNISASYFESQKIPVMYQLSDGKLLVDTVDLTTVQVSTDGTLVSLFGHTDFGTHHSGAKNMVTRNNISFVMFLGVDQITYAGVYNHGTSSWDIDVTQIGNKRYWDTHNVGSCFIDSSGKVIFMEGGRDGITTENLIMLQSDFALDSASFTLNMMNDWTDISPTTLNGRGYKNVVVDSSGIPHLFFVTDVSTMTVRSRRSGTWDSPKTIISLADSGNQLYWCGVQLDGNDDLNLTWGFSDNSIVPTAWAQTFYHNEINYQKLIYDGVGDYTAERADAVALTLPCSEINKDCIISVEDTGGTQGYVDWAASTAYSVNDFIFPTSRNGHGYRVKSISGSGTTDGSEPTWPTDHFDTVIDNPGANQVEFEEWSLNVSPDNEFLRSRFSDCEIIGTTTPLSLAWHVGDTDPHDFNTLKFYRWDGANWDATILQSADFPDAGRRVNGSMVVGTSGIFIVVPRTYSGVQELVQYQSEDNGVTWDNGTRLTNSSFDNETPMLSTRSATVDNLEHKQEIHIGYAEIMFQGIEISLPFPDWFPGVIQPFPYEREVVSY